MNKRDVPGIVGGVIFAAVWLFITRDPLQSLSTGVIFAIAWFVGRRYSEGRRQQKKSGQK